MLKLAQISLIFFVFAHNFSNAQFSQGTNLISETYQPGDIKAADIDNDGRKDVIVFRDFSDTISWYRNLGNYQYNQPQIVGGVSNAHTIEILDIDLDGDLDVIAANETSLILFTNQGNGAFDNGITIATLSILKNFLATDIDNDGDIDLFITTYDPGDIYFIENNAGILLTELIVISGVSSLVSTVFADIDGDSFVDLVTCSQFTNAIAWYKNMGAGSFAAPQNIGSSQIQPRIISCGDIDGNGYVDVFSGTSYPYGNTGVVCYKNQGNGLFNTPLNVHNQVNVVKEICLVDLDGDLMPEVITNLPNGSYSVTAIFNYDDINGFSTQSSVAYENQSDRIISEDMDNDGDNDVLRTSYDANQIYIHINDGLGNFTNTTHLSLLNNPSKGEFYDIDEDGDEDILSYNSEQVFWIENLGDSMYGAAFRVLPIDLTFFSVNISALVFEDFNNDGIKDLIIAGSQSNSGSFFYSQGLGLMNFTNAIQINQIPGYSHSIIADDINNDGYLDLILGSLDEVSFYLNLGNNTFASSGTIANTQVCRSIDYKDVDNDGLKDVLFASRNSNEVGWSKNLGGTFSMPIIITTTNLYPTGVKASDLDNDNDLDILVASENDDKISWYENLGSGNFGAEQLISWQMFGASDVWSDDIDFDGDMDIIAVGSPAGISWYENLGGGVFGSSQLILSSGQYGQKLFCGDSDNDGDIDILNINGNINVLRNEIISSLRVKGRLFADLNQNGIFDNDEVTIPQASIQCNPNAAYAYSYGDGRYFIRFDALVGNYEVAPSDVPFWNSTSPNPYSVSVVPGSSSLDNVDFGYYPDTLIDNIEIALIGGTPRCDTHVNYWIDYENNGTTIPSGIIELFLDDSLTYISASLVPDSIVGNHLFWSYDSISYFETNKILIVVKMPDFNSFGIELKSTVKIFTDDLVGSNYISEDTLKQIVRCAYDPNNKTATPDGIGSQGFIWPVPESLKYLIRFQNTGNDTALNVVLRDQLDSNLDWTSLHPIAGSHSYRVEMTMGGEVSFIFEDIMLPDSNVNELASHGFIQYTIDVLPNRLLGTVVENTANIYFDFNPAIITNTCVHTFDLEPQTNSIVNLDNANTFFNIYPNPFDGSINIKTNLDGKSFTIELFDISGNQQFKSDFIYSKNYTIDLNRLMKGVYLIYLRNSEGQIQTIKKVIKI